MLNQLIESKNHTSENTRRSSFLAGTLGVLVAVLLSGWTYSLFAKNVGMGTGEFELSSLVAPVAPVETEAPQPKPEVKVQKSQSPESDKIILKDLYRDIESTDVPPQDTKGAKDVVSAQKLNLDNVRIGDVNQVPAQPGGRDTSSNDSGCGLCQDETGSKADKEVDKTPEVVKPSPKPTEQKKPPTQSLGVINGKATYLAKPPYPAAAKAVRAEGAVNVQVLIDEQGNVVSASAVSGHPLLRTVAENAARQSKFSPTFLSKQPVKVTGVIVYQFKAY